MHLSVRVLACICLIVSSVACGSAEQGREALGFDREPPAATAPLPEAEPEPQRWFDSETPYVPTSNDAESCAVSRVVLRQRQRPVDIILVLDNSVSMAGELDAVERNINSHFASILDAAGVDYRVILISRHRNLARTRSDTAETAVCITQPLSALDTCPAAAPGQSARFFQYSTDIDSHDSLSSLLASYAQPDPVYRATTRGWSEWLREGTHKIILELSDDDSFTSADEFLTLITQLAPEHFGPSASEPSFVFHSIIGIAERDPADAAYGPGDPVVYDRCTNADRLAPSAGTIYQTLSRVTGGLRYPLCHLDNYDAIFESIAADSRDRSGLGCSFATPAPPAGKRLELAHFQLALEGTTGNATQLAAVSRAEDCRAGAFYAQGERIVLCPELCAGLLEQPAVTVSATFDCNAFIDVR